MTKPNKKLEHYLNHALHNEKVSDYLEVKQDFSDWTITSAFYSALKFVSYKIFPFEVDSINNKKTSIESIEDYYNYSNTINSKVKLKKHELLNNLVAEKCKKIADDYEWLLHMSMAARYVEHNQTKEISNKARTLMQKIKKECT